MKLKKLVLLTAITAALGSVNLFASFADEVEEEALQVGWVEVSAGNWQYFDTAGNRVVSKWIPAEEGDGRGNQVWFYVDGSGNMVANRTLTIDGTAYTFAEDGSWIDPSSSYQGAPRGAFSNTTFSNSWSNIRLNFPTMSYSADLDELLGYEDYFNDDDFASVGKPKLTYDFMVETTSHGDTLELYYADMNAMPGMSSAEFANAMAAIYAKTDYYTVKAGASDVNLCGQTYTKISLLNDVDFQKDLYCRKQDQYMVVLAATAEAGRMSALDNVIAGISAAR